MFNYIYYRVTRYYKQFKEGGEYFLMGIIIVSILQFLNLLAFLAFLSQYIDVVKRLFFYVKYENNKVAFLLMITALLAFNYVLYTKYINYTQLDAKWKFKLNSEYKRYNLYVIFYIFVSIVLVVLSSKFFLVKI
jgi:hypothetical protein